MHKHVIWDWNSTLLDDFHVCVAANDAACQALGGPAVDAQMYRDHHQRPFEAMYASLLGRPLREPEEATMHEVFNDRYYELLPGCTLTPGAVDALKQVEAHGGTQSLLSMWTQHQLEPLVTQFGIRDYFLAVDGKPHGLPHIKRNHLEDHIEGVLRAYGQAIDRQHITMIGDTVDDYDAAMFGSVNCVLFFNGADSREKLESTGAPVVTALPEALDIILG